MIQLATAKPVRAQKRGGLARSRVKQYVLDTNVLIHDPQSVLQFKEHFVWIPVEVLEELDRFKAESTTRGANAREVHRNLSAIFKNTKDMQNGVSLPNGGKIRVAINRNIRFIDDQWVLTAESPRFQLVKTLFPNLESPDNRILATAAYIADNEQPPTILVTKDLNMQLKAKALGLEVEDYRTDRVEDSDIRLTAHPTNHEEYETIEIPANRLQAFASQGEITISAGKKLELNKYILLANKEDQTHGIPARHLGDGQFRKLRNDFIGIRGGRTFKAANLGQRFFLDALFDPELTLITVYGKAGTGKTLLSVGAALQQVQQGDYDKLLITRVIMPTGKDIGFLPGSKEDKMQPWVQPAYDALDLLLSKPKTPEQFAHKHQSQRKHQHHSNGNGHIELHVNGNGHANGNGFAVSTGKPMHPYEPLLQNGTIEIEAMAHIRGRSIPNSIFIVDEAQQLTPHEAKTLVTRMGKGSKLILIGDLAQIDNPYVDANTNGLVYTRNRLEGQPFMTHINLFKGERSVMAEMAANLM
ncbi:MAG: PhoH family protein [Verrucomicrobiales bacterium]|jgi:PhoH-like ATPase|nr:PhoH family protein [Verrucomicrobiales bacterium]